MGRCCQFVLLFRISLNEDIATLSKGSRISWRILAKSQGIHKFKGTCSVLRLFAAGLTSSPGMPCFTQRSTSDEPPGGLLPGEARDARVSNLEKLFGELSETCDFVDDA